MTNKSDKKQPTSDFPGLIVGCAPALERELEYSERATWGECPYCHVEHGKQCIPSGIPLGFSVSGKIYSDDGVHFARLQKAPFKIRILPL